MAMVMVFSLLPTALAEGDGDEQPPVEPPPVETPEPGDPEEPEHTHTPSSNWTNDASGHWKTCTVTDCPDPEKKLEFSTHTYGNPEVIKPPTCEEAGTGKRVCSVCSYEDEVTIPKVEHSKGTSPVYMPISAEEHTWTCEFCKKPQAEEHTFVDGQCTLCYFKQTVTISLPSTLSLAVNETGTLTATVSPAGTAVSWSVTGSAVTISPSTGTSTTVTAVQAGRATITATAGGESASCTVTVTEGKVTITLDPTSYTFSSVSGRLTINPHLWQGNKEISADGHTITWSSNRTGVATVNASGIVTPVASGSAVITATLENGEKATCNVTVESPFKLSMVPSSGKLTAYGDSLKIYATFGGTAVASNKITWDVNEKYLSLSDGTGAATVSAVSPVSKTTVTAYYTVDKVRYTDTVDISVVFSTQNVATATVYNSTDSYNLDDPDDEGDDSIIEQMQDYFDSKSKYYYGLSHVVFTSKSDTYGSLSATTGRDYDVDGNSNSKYDLSDVTFTPSDKKTGTAVFSLTAYVYTDNRQNKTEGVSCTISFKVKEGEASGGDVEYTAALGEDVPFSASDFEDFWDDMYSRGELESVSFKVSGGTLRDSDGKTVGSKECYVSPTRSQIDLDGVYFEPNSTTSKKAGTVKFTFTATGYARNSSKSTTKTGTVSITYMAGSPKDISYTVNANGSVNLKASDFTAAYKEATGSNAPSGMTIILKSVPRNGTLTYTDSSKSRPTDLKLTSSNIKNRSFTTRSSGTNQINDISYSGNSGTDTIEYTAYSGNSAQFTGKIVFNGAPTAPTNLSVTFTSTNGSPATMSTAAFTTANATVMGKTYRMRFTTPTNGSLLLNGATTAVGVDIFPSNLGSVSYRPKAGFNGSDKCLFMAYDASGNLTGSGTVNFVVAGNPSTTNPGGNTGASSISQFKDVPATAWYRTELADLVSKGIIKGKSATSFAPRDNVTYGEALKMVLRAAGHTAEEATGNNWAINYKNLAVSKGWIDNSIVLTNAISRAAMADLVAKVLGVASSGAASPFADTANGYAVALYNTNPRIFNGETGKDGKLYFNGGDSLKREQICAVIYRVNQYYTNNSSNQMPDGI